MATRIALYEADGQAKFQQVDLRTKRVADGSDFFAVNPMGQVPVLRTDDDGVLTENPVVLQYIADLYPQSGLAPSGGMLRYRLQQWLNFISSELHKLVFMPLLDRTSTDGAKAFARNKAQQRFAYLNDHLNSRDYLLDRFTVADAYLVIVLNWAAVQADFRRLRERPSVARAFAEEFALYRDEQARRAAA